MTGPRERVVLSQRRGARIVRTRTEVQEHTEVGDALVKSLVRAQLALALRLSAVTLTVLCAIPLMSLIFPGISDVTVLGVRLPWIVLGVAVYPMLYVVGRIYIRQSERNENEFTELVDDD